jgi:catechol 2,3-dioxygenase-like lactoylglutathione lyase family enzyme
VTGIVDLAVHDVRVFLPAKDFELSKAFYVALGWKLAWSQSHLALLEVADRRFYLQNYYAKEWAENFMVHVTVDDAQACYAQIAALLASDRFPGARVAPPSREPYGAIVTYVTDPSGVLLHFAQWDRDGGDEHGRA